MRIIIASLGRAHLLDCARELQKHGHYVLFYSATPKKNFTKYGLERGGISLTLAVLPFIALSRFLPCNFTRWLYSKVLDIYVYIIMPKCDIFIAQSPNYQLCINKAKKNKAITILDRGSSHVRVVNELIKCYDGVKQCDRYIRRDEHQYKTVDYITIASDFVKKGFISNGIDNKRIFVNPYGFQSLHFYPTICSNEFDCIYVGQWNKRKGCKLIVDAFANTELKILHVGSITDYPFPQLPNFTHYDSVPEYELINFYSKAKVFIFPSYDDGYGLVLCQAISCGLPIVCSTNCGGTTIKNLIKDTKYILIMNDNTIYELRNKTFKALNIAKEQNNREREQSYKNIGNLTWEEYGIRYNNFITKINMKNHESSLD